VPDEAIVTVKLGGPAWRRPAQRHVPNGQTTTAHIASLTLATASLATASLAASSIIASQSSLATIASLALPLTSTPTAAASLAAAPTSPRGNTRNSPRQSQHVTSTASIRGSGSWQRQSQLAATAAATAAATTAAAVATAAATAAATRRSSHTATSSPNSNSSAPVPSLVSSVSPLVPNPNPNPDSPSLAPLELHGARTQPAGLLKLRGRIESVSTTLMIDSGASSEFIDTEFARRCGLKPTPSNRSIRLADGSIVRASGEVTIPFTLDGARNGAPVPFSTTFTVTPLKGYDAILGVTWLAAHDVLVGWRERAVTIRTPGRAQQTVKPISQFDSNSELAVAQIAGITMRNLARACRRGQCEEIFAIFVSPTSSAVSNSSGSGGSNSGSSRHPPPPLQLAAATATATAIATAAAAATKLLLLEFADVFPDKLPDGLPPLRGTQHRIELKPGSRPPPSRPLRHQSSKDLAIFEEYTRTMIEAGQLRVSNSPYGAMALIVRKKDGTARVVIDYRGLNDLTIKNKYPLPLMDEMFDRVTGATYFTKIDLRSGFHQIRIDEADCEKTAFRTRYGSFEYRVLPMGLCNAPGTFMQLMNDTFRDMLDRTVLVFLDDILVFSKTLEEHIVHVREVLTRLRTQQLYGKLSKCEFFAHEVEFLGHRIGVDGLAVMQDKVAAVREWPQPRDVHHVRSFLGLAGFYRRFVQAFSKIALPITNLTKDVPFVWGEEQTAAFVQLKHALCTAPVLLIADPSKPYTVNCDASNYAIGATLQQDHGNGLQPVAYFSRKLSSPETRYDTREKECLALVDACSHWRHYLHSDLPFTLLTDHDSLKYIKTMPNMVPRIARWVEKMAEFDYKIEHIAGVKNTVADAMSRRIDHKDAADGAAAAAAAAAAVAATAATATAATAAAVATAATLAAARLQPSPAVVAAHRVRDKQAAEECGPAAADRPQPNAHGAIVMPSQRCTALTKAGAQCKQRTAKGQYCWNHLRSLRGLRIKKSTIPGAGLGLFAARDLPLGTRIDYTGDRAPLRDDRDGGAYFLQLSSRKAIDAARTNAGEGRWVNDPKNSNMRANTEFVLHTPPGRPRIGCLRTIRLIPAGEEICVSYGRAYWRFALAQGKRVARKRGQVLASVVPVAADAVASVVTVARFESTFVGAAQAAAAADAEYAAAVASPPAGRVVANALLWHGEVLCVPNDAALRTRILSECHDTITGAHFGRDKTLEALRSRFEWPGMATAVELYVSTCDSCQRNKPSQQLTPGALMPLPLPDRPCQEWTQDAVTGLPKTKRGHDAIQVYVERLCKVKHFAATHSTDGAVALAASFVHTVVRAHGVPEAIISDRDPRFTANYYAELTKLLGVDLRMSTARHPQSDGQSEREIRTLITALRAFCNANQDDWDDYLDMYELGCNMTVQASTQQSPYELLYGMKPRLPIDVALAAIAPRNPAAIDRAKRMRQAMESAREHLLTAQQRQAHNASRRVAAPLAVGDMVLLTIEGLTLRNFTNKLCARYVGPFAVTAVVNANAYTLALPPRLQALHSTFNIDKLKPYRDGTATFPSRPQPFARPPPVAEADSNGDKAWEVERIVAQRKHGRGEQYLVAWKGYPAEENSWESRANLAGAAEALADWRALQLA
jgi:transposase InsO family protein